MSIKIIVKIKTIALAFHGTIHYMNGYNKSHKAFVDFSHQDFEGLTIAMLRNLQAILIKKYVKALFNQNNEERPRFFFFFNVGNGCSDMQIWKLILEVLSFYCQMLHKTQLWLEKLHSIKFLTDPQLQDQADYFYTWIFMLRFIDSSLWRMTFLKLVLLN